MLADDSGPVIDVPVMLADDSDPAVASPPTVAAPEMLSDAAASAPDTVQLASVKFVLLSSDNAMVRYTVYALALWYVCLYMRASDPLFFWMAIAFCTPPLPSE